MTNSDAFLPTPIHLPGGVVARIELTPMPQKGVDGRYPPSVGTDIQVSLLRDGKFIERRRWDSLICSMKVVRLIDGTALDEYDLHELDSRGWDLMLDCGIVPTTFVG